MPPSISAAGAKHLRAGEAGGDGIDCHRHPNQVARIDGEPTQNETMPVTCRLARQEGMAASACSSSSADTTTSGSVTFCSHT